jgi:hypothetical protein
MIVSPIAMDSKIEGQGTELHEVLQLFRQTTTTPLSKCVMHTPKQMILEKTYNSAKVQEQSNPLKKKPKDHG